MSAEQSELSDELQRVLQEFGASLKPLSPEEGLQKFLLNEETEVIPGTVQEYERKLEWFLDFCESNEIEDTTEFDGRVIQDFKIWRRDEASTKDGQLSNKTLRDDMYLFRQFLRFLESIDAVTPQLHRKVDIPSLDPEDGSRDIEFESEELDRILSHLEQYQYATREHAVWIMFAATGRRPGGLRSLDLDHVHLDDDPHVEFHHTAGETRLKNGKKSENTVSLNTEAAQMLQDYVDTSRHELEDGERSPFLTSPQGRLTVSTMRKYIYKWSRPCSIGMECPEGRDPDGCEGMVNAGCASKCPYSKPPVALRHGYISDLRRQGVSITVISERCDVSEEIIRENYSELDESEKRELRRSELEKHSSDGYL